mmetsp:Transcript_31233/g.38022  ORF Transcript_31233/g.38022 Transcript_31233/m.38022 type:complete len:232 (+) Transcript_31233:25-720(+)
MFFKSFRIGTLYCLLSQAHSLSASDPNMVNIKNLRVAYNDFSKQLLESNINMAEPFSNFQEWLNSAIESKVEEPNAMNIATVDERGRPSSRLVLCKEVRKGEGLVFFTHSTSRKGQCLAKNPYIAATFFWPEVHRQIRIEGITEILPDEVAEEYFNSRSKESRAASACSDQSKVIASKPELMEKYEKMMEEEEPKRPGAWRGYLIKPDYFEFWQGNSHRLHDRIVFKKRQL